MTRTWNNLAGKAIPIDVVDNEFANLTARVFDTPSGREWLEHMREEKFGRHVAPNIDPDSLRFLEGQRQFVRDIDRLTAIGAEQIKRRMSLKRT